MQYKTALTFGLLALMDVVAGHAAILSATGDAGGQGTAIGSMSYSISVSPFVALLLIMSISC